MGERIKDRCKDFITVDEALAMDYEKVKELQLKHLNHLRTTICGAQYYVKAEDCIMIDHKGREVIDMLGGVAVKAVGNNNPFIWGELEKAFHAKQNAIDAITYHTTASAFAHNLSQLSFGGRLTKMGTACGGAEANEAMLKVVKMASRDKGRTRLLAAERAFHGKTTGTVSLGGNEFYRSFQHPLMENVDHIPYGDERILEEYLSKGFYMALFLEPIQGEAGIRIPPKGYFKKVRELCDKYDVILAIDEVQMGCGRTGKLWATEWEDIVPDIISFGKSYTGGLIPFAGFLCKEEIYNKAYDEITFMHHTATYQDNLMGAAAGLATLEFLLDNGLIEQAEEKGAFFRDGIQKLIEKYPGVLKEVRGRGLIFGIDSFEIPEDKKGVFDNKYNTFTDFLAYELNCNYGVTTCPPANSAVTFRMAPPLTITKELLQEALNRIETVVKIAYDAVYK